MELGIIGLGKMGGNLAIRCIDEGIRVVGKARGLLSLERDLSVYWRL